MPPLGSIPFVAPGVAASAAGTFSTGLSERSAALDAAGHSLAARRKELSLHPLDGDPNAAPDRDADGWTGGSEGAEEGGGSLTGKSAEPMREPTRPRLPDDPRGERLDVTV